ncbi:Tfp pilus assembly protein PilF [Nitrosospira briensis]|uniref:Tfp pilus assembly protein PilF n=1 Tax=Nitrosospira briensis TaxID=35799 RepID=A0A1I4Z548_9PROT|nr:class I SAM-dependent methyltransferase [Nitrosospira briensis]SFN45416.1 Tfp pilus assembly protein PilF [Nitrosospira briensis]
MKKISRNDPCPCKSGKKYKYCCQELEKMSTARTSSAASPTPSISEYLQTGIQYHQAGHLPQAEAIYHRILQVTPEHPGALHFMGLIARQTGKIEAAIELISRALAFKPDYAEAHGNLGNVFKQQGRLEDAINSYRKALNLKPDMAEVYANLGNALMEQGKLDDAIANYRKGLAVKPDLAEMHCNLGNALREQGKLDDAAASYRKALTLNPGFAEAHNNLGNLLNEQGKREEAILRFKKALHLRPNFAEACSNLGNALRELGRLDEAVASYQNALALRPDYAQAYSNLGNALREQGKLDEAIISYQSGLRISEDPDIKQGFAQCIRNVSFTHEIPGIRPLIIRAMREPWERPAELANPAISLVKLNPGIRKWIARASNGALNGNCAAGTRSPEQELARSSGSPDLAPVYDDLLLHCVLETTPVCDAKLERVLTAIRSAMLDAVVSSENHGRVRDASDADKDKLAFYCALARQSFINEYVFSCPQEEFNQAQSLKNRLAAALASKEPVLPLWLPAVAAYFPLASLPSVEALLASPWPDAVAALLVQQVEEPLEERRYRPLMPRLTPIADAISITVQKQYEENPYPRWVKLPRSKAVSIEDYLRNKFPLSSFTPRSRVNEADRRLDILIAGCGTGQHSISTAQRYRNAKVLAVDLSLTSLCYAKRKTRELGLKNIDYAQADILSLDSLSSADHTFDIVESVGVLHHLADPLAGWRKLVSLMRPGAFMRLGFYSEYARRNETAARRFIAERGYASNPGDIRRCRQELMSAENAAQFRQILSARDFYTVSECRDLLFHVQEHRYTLPQLKENLRELELTFIGFSLDSAVIKQYGQRFPDDIPQANLDNWHMFELEHPDTFTGMYQFWVQKRG